MIKTFQRLLFSLLFVSSFSFTYSFDDCSVEEVFTSIYDNEVWGVEGEKCLSGFGSTVKSTEEYRRFIQNVFVLADIHSVVDAGCGDWVFSKEINWKGINYIGYDAVLSVIEENKNKYGKSNISFIQGDILSIDLPPADLLICKDVLQHLTNEDVLTFIKQLPKFKYCLITNDIDRATNTSQNQDIQRGDYRTIDLTRPPFSVKGTKILTYQVGWATKQVLLIKHQ
jgi:SAM-dependent methyltransferase